MKRRTLTIFMAMLVASVPAVANQVYSWTDANGVVHFSQQPPSGDVTTSPVQTKQVQAADTATETPQARQRISGVITRIESPSAEQLVRLEADQLCEQSRHNMLLLEQDNATQIDPGNGKKQVLNKSQRAQEIALARNHIEIYCKETQ